MRSSKSVTHLGLVALISLAAGIGGCEDHGGNNPGITVMTQNLYYGFDVNPLLGAASPDDVPILAAQAFQQLILTNFAERAGAIADEIARKRPHLIGLQEVALFRLQSPGDAVAGGTVPADAVLFDHLEILMAALAARGLEYVVAGKVQNVDVELPMLTAVDPPAFDDIRLTDFDVVLARKDVVVSRTAAVNYQARAFVPALGLEIPRGYVAIDAQVGGQGPFRFVTTHLEDAPFLDVQAAQVRELAAALASETKPVVLLGDFNSPAPSGDAPAYLASQGYADLWTRSPGRGADPGLTWGHDADLRNPADLFTQRLDLVLVRMNDGRQVASEFAEIWGDDLDERTTSGLWPSDHAAVIVGLRLLPPAHRFPRPR
jgi:endonuclease/exonuclease/phosphatase family metal-dependent hydrolase